MTYLLEANKSLELRQASRHISRMRCRGEREKDISLLLRRLCFPVRPCQVRQCSFPESLIDAANVKAWQWLHGAQHDSQCAAVIYWTKTSTADAQPWGASQHLQKLMETSHPLNANDPP